jgi:hypothetical protein
MQIIDSQNDVEFPTDLRGITSGLGTCISKVLRSALMFVAIVGTRCSGKSTVRDFLVNKGFQLIVLVNPDVRVSFRANHVFIHSA